MNPQDFVNRWAQSTLREQQAAQSHFNELCQLVGHPTPTQLDPKGEFFTFEEHVEKATGGRGRADVWYKGHFAWEYKGKLKDLDAAYSQLLSYRGDLDNPPLLVVSDFLEYRIYPQWTNTSGQPFVFHNEDLRQPRYRRYIEWLLTDPEQFRREREEELARRERLTQTLAEKFASLARRMREHTGPDGQRLWTPMQVARFLTRLTFVLFAEDVKLLPVVESKTAFRYILDTAAADPAIFVPELRDLLAAMDGRRARYMAKPVPFFNGGLFRPEGDEGDQPEILDITDIPIAIDLLQQANAADWREVNPTIFGTLFEGALDEGKRAQLGAHYTSESDIQLVLEPVLMQPLNRLWDAIRAEAEPHLQTLVNADAPPRDQQAAREQLLPLHDRMMAALETTTVLDPACGSGNFLYMSLRLLKDLEQRARAFFAPLNLPFRDVVTPRQLYGIEKDEFAAKLAQVVVWIGYLQWRYEHEGALHATLPNRAPTPHDLPNPILQDRRSPDEPEHIQRADAIMRYRNGVPYEPEWPAATVIVGNPPFLGGYKRREQLGAEYLADLFSVFDKRVPNDADLVCYWFERARQQLEQKKVKRVGLLATNSIRGGSNRKVLDRIKQTGDIFMAYPDNAWVLDGAAVRVSIVGFDDGSEKRRIFNGVSTSTEINPDLTNTVDVTSARPLPQNADLVARGIETGGPFELSAIEAASLSNNPQYRPILVPILNGKDVTERPRGMSVIDFAQVPDRAPETYSEVYNLLKHKWDKELSRTSGRIPQFRNNWWEFRRSGEKLRNIVTNLSRYICTPRVAKHRLFVWVYRPTLPDSALFVFARDDDYFFGVLHSYLHEVWSLRMGTSLEDRPRYTPTTTFETFPFPWPPGHEDTSSPAYAAISAAAKALHEERDAWLNPPEFQLGSNDVKAHSSSAKALRERTLTNLYNALEDYRAGKPGRRENAASVFAPRLAELHQRLDDAVLLAYGWSDLSGLLRTPDGDEALLRRLLALNLARGT